jgi:hypothetical protein
LTETEYGIDRRRQNANDSIGLSTGGFTYASVSAGIRKKI